MADKKKINLPTIRSNLDRREFIGGAASLVGQAALDIPTGKLIDAIGKGGLSSLGAVKEKQLLIELGRLNMSITETLEEADLWKAVHSSNQDTGRWLNLFRDPEAYSEALEDLANKEYMDYIESGESDASVDEPSIAQEHKERMQQIQSVQNRILSYEKKYSDTLWELGGLHREKYPKEVVEDLYRIPATSGSNTDPVTGKMIVEKGKYTNKLPFLIARIAQTIRTDEDYPERRSESSLDEDISRTIEDGLPPLLEAPKDKVEDRIKKIAGAVGSQALGRALTQLAINSQLEKPKDPKQKAKGPKQIAGPEKTEKPSINKLLTALSLFKRGTPLGAAAYAMGPTATAEDDDYDFEIPVDR
jgi:hypothetical protein